MPDPIFYKRLQCLGTKAVMLTCRGPIDGVTGPNSGRRAAERLQVGGYLHLLVYFDECDSPGMI